MQKQFAAAASPQHLVHIWSFSLDFEIGCVSIAWSVHLLPPLGGEVIILLTHRRKSGWWRWFQTLGKSFATGCDARIS